MTAQADKAPEPRIPLSRERVLRAAVDLADREGIESLTMRHLAEQLGVEAMSLYYHVENKKALLEGVVDVIVGEINEAISELHAPPPEEDWKTALRMRILAARSVLLRHPWAPGVIEARSSMSPTIVLYHEGLLEILRKGGFSYDLAHHAMHALGSRAMGFTQELFQPADDEDDAGIGFLQEMADQLPYLVGMLQEIAHDHPESTLGWCDDQTEFLFGLDLLLDGLEARLRDD
jgi:AcrR family transcriptional regulator